MTIIFDEFVNHVKEYYPAYNEIRKSGKDNEIILHADGWVIFNEKRRQNKTSKYIR